MRRWWVLGALVATCTFVAGASACAEETKPPTLLINGVPAESPPIRLEGIGEDQIATRVVVEANEVAPITPGAAKCLRRARDHPAVGPVISRVGVNGESVTFRASSGQSLVACDSTAVGDGSRDNGCGIAVGRLEDGGLQDPRLDLAGCRTAAADPLAFAWVEPARGTRYVAVDQPGFIEVYRVVAGLPVRITTTSGIDQGASRASFRVTEHDRSGRLLRGYMLEARVAG